MKKAKVLLQCILYIFLFLFVNFGTVTIFTLAYNFFNKVDVDSLQYVEQLASFLNKSKMFITLVSGFLLFPVIYNNIKIQKTKINFQLGSKYLYFMFIGISISMILNIMMYSIGLNKVDETMITFSLSSIVSTAIFGPIIEELIFRNVIYSKLKETFSVISSIIITSLFFGIFHLNIIQAIYAFLFSLVTTYMYEKYNNLIVPICIHCFGNLSVSLIFPFIIKMPFIYVQMIWIMCVLLILFCLFKLLKKDFYH